MHTDEELNFAILELYKDYKDIVKKMKLNDKTYIFNLAKINKDERKYKKEEVLYIGINALNLLELDIKNNNI
ncbi:MAG: hypothetical protein IJK66_05095 [Bacilli bacterium]|nr:hypothetical protein [Bacilli bacterium]